MRCSPLVPGLPYSADLSAPVDLCYGRTTILVTQINYISLQCEPFQQGWADKMSAKNHSGRVFSIHSGRKRIAQISWVCTCICALSIQRVLSLLETKCNKTFFYHNHASRPANLTNHDVANHCLGQHIKRVQPFPECKQMQNASCYKIESIYITVNTKCILLIRAKVLTFFHTVNYQLLKSKIDILQKLTWKTKTFLYICAL